MTCLLVLSEYLLKVSKELYQRAMTCLQVLSEYLLKASKELFQTKIPSYTTREP